MPYRCLLRTRACACGNMRVNTRARACSIYVRRIPTIITPTNFLPRRSQGLRVVHDLTQRGCLRFPSVSMGTLPTARRGRRSGDIDLDVDKDMDVDMDVDLDPGHGWTCRRQWIHGYMDTWI